MVRRYRRGEEQQVWNVYYTSNHSVVARNYTQQQIQRWAPSTTHPPDWPDRLQRTNPFVAVLDENIVGFAELLPSGQLDYFYCHGNFQRRGIGSALMQAVEQEARRSGIIRLVADVSTTAVDFFLANGFQIIHERQHVVCDAPAHQYHMQKQLRPHTDSQTD